MLCGGDKKDTDGAKLEDSNMAGYNSPTAKKVRKAAADTEKEWDGAGAAEGIEIWRIENFGVKRWPKEEYGNFFSGDSYIVLHTYKPDPDSADLDYNVYFWLGSTTTQDEYGTAAYKTVELDDKLGGEPVQFREVQGQEGDEFTDLFPEMTVMEGGIASAFNKVEPEKFENKLFLVRGKGMKSVKSQEVALSVKSLCMNDSYVLDSGMKLFSVAFGGASVWEKRKANDMVDKLQDKRGTSDDYRIDSFDEDSEGAKLFWEILGGKPDSLPDTVEATAPEEEKKEDGGMAVFKVTDACSDKKTTVSEMAVELVDGKLPRSILKDNNSDVVVVDPGSGCLYIWAGSGASKTERKMAMPLILEAVEAYAKRPVRKMVEGKETPAFNALFAE